MRGLVIVLFLLHLHSIHAQNALPDSILNIQWKVARIITAEHSISSDSIRNWLDGNDLTVRIVQKTTKCFPDQSEMNYLLWTRICNSCSFQFNILDGRITKCSTLCTLVYCTDGKGGYSPRGRLEEILKPILHRPTTISIGTDQMKILSENGSEMILTR